MKCHLCGLENSIHVFKDYGEFRRVTSDCKPWKRGGELGYCPSCRAVQKNVSGQFLGECQVIYQKYDAYFQSAGFDSMVTDSSSVSPNSRSGTILDFVRRKIAFPHEGRFLDIGCGNGNMLLAANRLLSQWKLYGFDLDPSAQRLIESIDGVKKYYSGKIDNIHTQFDVVSMVHVLEHIPNPLDYLLNIRRLLVASGVLIIEVPDLQSNPFDLLIADHVTHFTKSRLGRLIHDAGYTIGLCTNEIVPKELTLIAIKTEKPAEDSWPPDVDLDLHTRSCITWLKTVRRSVQNLKEPSVGLFGAGIGTAWLLGEFYKKIQFCVDEDKNKIGKDYLGKSVYHPRMVENSHIVVPLPYAIARKVYDRWEGLNGNRYLIGSDFQGGV